MQTRQHIVNLLFYVLGVAFIVGGFYIALQLQWAVQPLP
jgi:hypothetical protein